MSQEDFRDPSFIKDLSRESKERTVQELEAMGNRLGFSETEELSNLEQRIVSNPEQRSQLMGEWQSSAEKVVDALSEEKKINAQLGLIVRQAAILQKAGMRDDYNQALEQAIDIAYQLGEDDIAQKLKKF